LAYYGPASIVVIDVLAMPICQNQSYIRPSTSKVADNDG
jgi:hypothetical protein